MGKNQYNPDYCISPIITIIDTLKGLYETSEFVIDEQKAKCLEVITGVSAQFWLNCENNYRDGLSRGLTDLTGEMFL